MNQYDIVEKYSYIKLSIDNSMNPDKEVEWWHTIYEEFKTAVCVEKWSGHVVVRMPHFSAIPVEHRDSLRPAVIETLQKFVTAKVAHRDVKWSNIGWYKKKDKVHVVIYDLGRVEATGDESWVEIAMAKLF